MGAISILTRPVKPVFPVVTKAHVAPSYRFLVIDLSHTNDFRLLSEHLIDYAEYLLAEIEKLLKMDGKRIETFTIGKTYAIAKKKYVGKTSMAEIASNSE